MNCWKNRGYIITCITDDESVEVRKDVWNFCTKLGVAKK